jgi:hypothetical protein
MKCKYSVILDNLFRVLKNEGLGDQDIEEIEFEDSHDNDGAVIWDEHSILVDEEFEVVEFN